MIQARGRICDPSNAGINVKHQIMTLTVMNVGTFKSVQEKKKKLTWHARLNISLNPLKIYLAFDLVIYQMEVFSKCRSHSCNLHAFPFRSEGENPKNGARSGFQTPVLFVASTYIQQMHDYIITKPQII